MKRYCTIFFIVQLCTPLVAQDIPNGNNHWRIGSLIQKYIDLSKNPNTTDDRKELSTIISLREGWPVKVGLWPNYPVAADLIGDGVNEVIISPPSNCEDISHSGGR